MRADDRVARRVGEIVEIEHWSRHARTRQNHHPPWRPTRRIRPESKRDRRSLKGDFNEATVIVVANERANIRVAWFHRNDRR